MHKLLVTAAAAALAGGMAVAQAQVVLEPEVQTQVREFVVGAEPVAPDVDFEVAVGAAVPETVELRAIEGIPAVAQYRYVLVDDRIVLVDPRTRIIVSMIEPAGTGEGGGAAGQPGADQAAEPAGEAAPGADAGAAGGADGGGQAGQGADGGAGQGGDDQGGGGAGGAGGAGEGGGGEGGAN